MSEDGSFGGWDPSKDWLPDPSTMERDVFGDREDPTARAKRVLRESVDNVAMTVVQLALHGVSERIRLEAAKYVIERVFAMTNDPDVLTPNQQIKAVGGVLQRAIGQLGLDGDDPQVRETFHRALTELSTSK